MRKDFDATVPHVEQLLALDAAKTPGRKHLKQPGVKAKQRKANQALRGAAERERQSRKYRARVAAYWRGELDSYPE